MIDLDVTVRKTGSLPGYFLVLVECDWTTVGFVLHCEGSEDNEDIAAERHSEAIAAFHVERCRWCLTSQQSMLLH